METEFMKIYLYALSSITYGDIWLMVYGLALAFTISVAISKFLKHCQEKAMIINKKMTESYVQVMDKLELVQSKLENLQKLCENQSLVQKQLAASILEEIHTTKAFNQAPSGTQPAPPPPPPPPPMFLVTPVAAGALVSKTEGSKKNKKALDGPPQMRLTQDDISNMLRKLKKTSNKPKLLGADKHGRKSPTRRTLFGRESPFVQKRRSVTINMEDRVHIDVAGTPRRKWKTPTKRTSGKDVEKDDKKL